MNQADTNKSKSPSLLFWKVDPLKDNLRFDEELFVDAIVIVVVIVVAAVAAVALTVVAADAVAVAVAVVVVVVVVDVATGVVGF